MAVTALPAWSRLGTAPGWPVLLILAGQAALTLRLMWRDGAAPAEAAYLNNWPLDPGHWLPGAAGLTAGRLMSLALMLVATTLLHGTTRRLYDRRSAFFAGALFAALAGALVTIAARQGWPVSLLSVVLTAAPLAIPAETMRVQLGSWQAVPCCCGAWLGCVIAGSGVASLARGVPRARSAAAFGVGIGAVVLAVVPGAGWAVQQVSWPQAGPVVSRVQALLASHDGPVLTDGTGDQLRLYLGGSLARRVVMQAGAGGGVRQCDPAACRAAIAQHRFGVIVLSLWHAGPASYQLQRAIVLAGYRRVAPVPAAAGRPGAAAGTGAAAGSGAATAAGTGGTGAGLWNVWVRAGRP